MKNGKENYCKEIHLKTNSEETLINKNQPEIDNLQEIQERERRSTLNCQKIRQKTYPKRLIDFKEQFQIKIRI